MPDKTYKADPANAWCMAGFFVSGFAMLTMAAISVHATGVTRAGPSDSMTTAIVALMAAAGAFCGWLALKTVIGAACGMPRVTISDTRVTVEGAIGGTRWADWSSISAFVVTVSGRKRIPVALARITGPGVSRNLSGKADFAVGGALTITLADLTAALNAARPPSAGITAPPPPEDAKARLGADKPSGLSRGTIVLIWCAILAQNAFLYTVLFRE
jgi:hypothetical protein